MAGDANLDVKALIEVVDVGGAEEYVYDMAASLINFTDQTKVRDSWPDNWGG